jgi:hypothetical protein
MAKRAGVTVKLIVRRGAVDRFQKLRKKTADLPVEVSWDRRKGDRRTASHGVQAERRKNDRRKQPPFTWELSDFVVVEKTRRRRKK